MSRIIKSKMKLNWAFVLIALLALLPACATEKSAPPPAVQAPPAMRMVISSSVNGLPQEGLWKCTPVFADVNADGFLDLAAISRVGDGAHVWLGDGTGNWKDSSSGLERSGSCGGGVAFGDLNNDGRIDLAVADHCAGAFVFLGDGRGGWSAATERLHQVVMDPAPEKEEGNGKEDNDDKEDVIDKKDGSDKEDENDENEEQNNEGIDKTGPIGAEDIAVGDVNEDGYLDLVVASSDEGGIAVYLGDGSGKTWKQVLSDGLPSWEDPVLAPERHGGWANKVRLHDMNGDNHLDVVAAYHLGPRVWLGDGAGRFQLRSEGLSSPPMGGLYRGFDIADLNKDGYPDLVIANIFQGPEVFLQRPDGSWQREPDIFPDLLGGAVGLALGDLNRDGHLDMIVTGRKFKLKGNAYGIFLLQGDGRGGWKELEGTNLPDKGLSVTWGVGIGDVNGDTLPDFAVGTGGAVLSGKDAVSELTLPRMQVWINRYGTEVLTQNPAPGGKL